MGSRQTTECADRLLCCDELPSARWENREITRNFLVNIPRESAIQNGVRLAPRIRSAPSGFVSDLAVPQFHYPADLASSREVASADSDGAYGNSQANFSCLTPARFRLTRFTGLLWLKRFPSADHHYVAVQPVGYGPVFAA